MLLTPFINKDARGDYLVVFIKILSKIEFSGAFFAWDAGFLRTRIEYQLRIFKQGDRFLAGFVRHLGIPHLSCLPAMFFISTYLTDNLYIHVSYGNGFPQNSSSDFRLERVFHYQINLDPQ